MRWDESPELVTRSEYRVFSQQPFILINQTHNTPSIIHSITMYTWINLVSHRSRCRLKYFGSQSARHSGYYPNHREGYPGTTSHHHNHEDIDVWEHTEEISECLAFWGLVTADDGVDVVTIATGFNWVPLHIILGVVNVSEHWTNEIKESSPLDSILVLCITCDGSNDIAKGSRKCSILSSSTSYLASSMSLVCESWPPAWSSVCKQTAAILRVCIRGDCWRLWVATRARSCLTCDGGLRLYAATVSADCPTVVGPQWTLPNRIFTTIFDDFSSNICHDSSPFSANKVPSMFTSVLGNSVTGIIRVRRDKLGISYGLLDNTETRHMSSNITASLWIISIIMGKWAKPNISDLEKDLLNNSMKSISWQLINIILKKLCTKKNKEKLSNCFWENWQKIAKPNLTFFGSFEPWKMTFRVIQSNPSFGSPSAPSLGSFMTKQRKGYQTSFEKIASKCKMGQILPFWPLKLTFRMIQPNSHFTVHWYLPNKAPCQRKINQTVSEK